MLDVILQKSYLHWILNSSTKPRDEDVIRSLISVDVCFNNRITRQRLKKTIWRYLKGEISSNGSRTKWWRTKWYGQNGMDKMVYRQNGIGQNGMDKMVRRKWYG